MSLDDEQIWSFREYHPRSGYRLDLDRDAYASGPAPPEGGHYVSERQRNGWHILLYRDPEQFTCEAGPLEAGDVHGKRAVGRRPALTDLVPQVGRCAAKASDGAERPCIRDCCREPPTAIA